MAEPSNCSITHRQIADGTCPHCGLLIATDSTASPVGAGTPGLRWDLVRMLDDLDRDDEATRLTTIFNLSDHLPPLVEALPVVRKACQDRAQRVRDRALMAAVRLCSSTDGLVLVETCESLLRQAPADLATLHVLLHFYASAQGRGDSYRKARHALILRVIEDMPEFPHSLGVPMKLFPEEDQDAFERAKALWLKQVQRYRDNARVLENASVFFRAVDESMAGKLLRKCKKLDPSNPRWSRELGWLYSFQGDPKQPESHKDWGLMSLAELETAWRSETNPQDRFLALLRIPTVCLNAGEIEKAREYAEKLLIAAAEQPHEYTQIWGDREANMALGWYALHKNDFDGARMRLFGARLPTAAYLGSCYCFMDPLMKLVGWMLYREQHVAVLEYLRRDQQLVPEFRERLVTWANQIEQGQTPDLQEMALLRDNLEVDKRSARNPASRWTSSPGPGR